VKFDYSNQIGVNKKQVELRRGYYYGASQGFPGYYYPATYLVATKNTKILSLGCDYFFLDNQLVLSLGGGVGFRNFVWKEDGFKSEHIPYKNGTDRSFTVSGELSLTYIFNFKKKDKISN
jgi:hypothetical protein